jgi:hypothetical protein
MAKRTMATGTEGRVMGSNVDQERSGRRLGPLGLLDRHCEALPAEKLEKLAILEAVDMSPEKVSMFRHQPEHFLMMDVIERG